MRVSFHNIGCKVNFAELSQIQAQFEELGYDVVNFGQEADIVLINTCTVTNKADADSRKVIRRARKSSPNAFVGVLGCYAQMKPDEVAAINGVDAVFGIQDKFNIPKLIDKFEKNEETCMYVKPLEDLRFDPACTYDADTRTRVTMKLQDGCDYKCTYCTIPAARGYSRSMDFDKAMDKFREIDEQGYREVVLSGVNLGDYKAPTGENFTDLIRAVAEQDFNFRIRISSIEPNLLTDEIIEIAATSDTLAPHFHIPLQSGSPEILKKMRRRYKADFYRDLIFKIKDRIPHCGIGVDVITGFPGETDSHFRETYDLLEYITATYLHVFGYSDRSGTNAAELDGKVDPQVQKDRTHSLIELSNRKKMQFYDSMIGTEQEVIPEFYDQRQHIWKGFTGNYIKTRIRGPENITHDFHRVRLEKVEHDFVLAELSEEVETV